MKKIFLVGDPSVDLLVNYQSNQTPKGNYKQTKNLENNPKANFQKIPGGVLLLKSFLNHIKNEGDQLITYQDMDVDEISKIVATQTIVTVKNYDPKHPEIIHVDKFLGYSYNRIANDSKKLGIEGDFSDADLIIIDDAGNEFRKEENDWVNKLDAVNRSFQIIHKINWPFEGNEFIPMLCDKCAHRAIAIVSADDLREHGLQISKQLSWDKTIEDFMTEFPANKQLDDLRKYGTIIIRFNLEACIVMFGKAEAASKKNETEKFDSYFFYLPSKYEGQVMAESKGNMQGITHVFIAGFANKILYPGGANEKSGEKRNERIDIITAIISGMNAANNCVKFGYHYNNQLSEINYPFASIFNNGKEEVKTIGSEKENNKLNADGKTELPVQVASIKVYADKNKPESLLKHFSSASKDWIKSVALGYVKENNALALQKIPVFRIGKFKTYDREEIESFRGFNKLITEYLYSKASKPMSFAVFGPPGSGKSFGVKQIVESDTFKDQVQMIEINLSQLQSYIDLVPLFQEARDITLTGKKIPLIFFDEFDASYGEKSLGWIKYFLAPMQDGLFKDGEKMHPLGKAVFVFAGGTKDSFQDFASQLKEPSKKESRNQISKKVEKSYDEKTNLSIAELKALKVPDFISRLKGFINIKGIECKDDSDTLYLLRRAIVLRTMLERDYPNLMDKSENIHIDNDLLEALMLTRKFVYGSRSLEAIIKMSDLSNERSFKKSNLPSDILLSLHVDVLQFGQILKERKVFPSQHIEPIAIEIHNRWLEKEIKKVSTKETVVEWNKSTEETKNSNRGQAIDILRKLNAIGYIIVRNEKSKSNITTFADDEMELMAEMEHDRWNEEKISIGWTYGNIRNDALKIHNCLLPWEDMPEDIKEYDRDAVKAIPEILNKVGFAVVKESISSN